MPSRLSRSLLLSLALVLPVASGAVLSSATADDAPGGADRPVLRATAVAKDNDRRLLDKPLRGAAAISELGANLDLAAERSHVTTAKLTKLLRTDKTAWIAPNGRLFYADAAAHEIPDVAQDIAPPTKPLAQTFLLHSKPGSAHTMYLDFNGYTLPSGADWTVADPSEPTAFIPAGTFNGFTIDSSYSTWTTDEQAYVQEVWRIVAEKYAAVDVDVTTQDPGNAALNRAGAGDTTYGNRLVFTNDSRAKPASVCPPGCLGVGFVGSFDDPTDNANLSEPAWVYTSQLTDIPSYTANVAAHEAGHNLGLLHDGTVTDGDGSYYEGHGNWFPIMGAGINAVGQFSKGEYADANETEDDLAVIASHGATERADDWGDVATPSALGQSTSYAVDGIISGASDVDAFTIDRTCTSPMKVTATGIGEGQSLDIGLTVKGPGGPFTADPGSSQVTTTFPYTPTGLDASLSVPNPTAGSYQIEVDGVGHGSPLTDGYSDYGSIGQYHLTISGCAGANGATPAVPASVTLTPVIKTTTANLTWTAPASPGDSPVTGYRITGTPAGTIDVPGTSTSRVLTGLSPGTSYTVSVQALNQFGAGDPTSDTAYVPTYMPASAPGMIIRVAGSVAYITPVAPANRGHADYTSWVLTISGQNFGAADYDTTGYYRISGFPNGTFTARLTLHGSADYGSVTPTAVRSFGVGASAPRIGRATSGARGGKVTATARWASPVRLGGYPIRGYRVLAHKLDSRGKIVRTYASTVRPASSRAFVFRLPKGRYKFRVVAMNALGYTDLSGYSRIVIAR